MKKMDSILKGLIALVFFVPLLFTHTISQNFVFPFIVPKILAFRTIALLMLLVYVTLLLSQSQKYKIKKSPLTIAVLIYFISFALSTFFGVDAYRSFWDGHERMLGLFTLLHYAIFYFVVSSSIKGWKDWRWILRIFLFAGALEMFMGILQKGNPHLFFNQGSARIDGTLGNPIYYGGYALYIFFLGLFMTMKEEKKYYRVFSIVAMLLGFVGVWLSGTRGTQLALIGCAGFAMLVYFFVLKGHQKIRMLLAAFMVLGVVFFVGLFAAKDTAFVQNVSFLRRIANISLTEGTGYTRLLAWGVGVDAWKENPIIGWGPNNFMFGFNKYYRAEFLRHGWGETWFDNAHNVVVNTLTTQGVIGLLSYLGIYVVVFYLLIVAVQKKKIDPHTAVIWAAFFVGHLIHNLFVFENPTSYIYFFFALAFVASMTRDGFSDHSQEEQVTKNPSLPIVGIGAVVILFLIYSTNYLPMKANRALLMSINAVNTGGPQIQAFERVKQYGTPHIDDIRHDFAQAVWQAAPVYAENGRGQEILDVAKVADRELEKNHELHPLDVREMVLHYELLSAMYNLSQDSSYIKQAKELMERAVELSPKRQQVLYSLAHIAYIEEDYDTALMYLQRSQQDDPIITETYFRMASIYRARGEYEKIYEVMEDMERNIPQLKENDQKIIAQIRADVTALMVSSTEADVPAIKY
ncbi:O-antigen ligase family protein [Candidatus Nomurabacteria bacterium]|nr:O-antigen ligase family protein [Candidatus Nomurabacteria bacterium]